MKALAAFLVAALLLLGGCLIGGAPSIPDPGSRSGLTPTPSGDPGEGAQGLLWVRAASYRFNVTDAEGALVAVRQYTVMGLNTSTGAPCWDVLREEARPAAEGGGWRVLKPVQLSFNASSGGVCATSWYESGGERITVVYRPEMLPFWPVKKWRSGGGDAHWNRTDGTFGTEVDGWNVTYEGRVALTVANATFQDAEVFRMIFAVSGEAIQRDIVRVWYSPKAGFFVKRASLATGETEELVANRDPIPGFLKG